MKRNAINDVLNAAREAWEQVAFVSLVLSGAPATAPVRRCVVRPVVVKEERRLQWSERRERQELHQNLTISESLTRLRELIGHTYRNATLTTAAALVQMRCTKRGRFQISTRPVASPAAATEAQHNQVRRHVLPEGTPCEFLHAIGVMTADGGVRAQQRHKFRQINRYLEFVRDIAADLPAEGRLEVIDCGSGKSGLTFALQHYLTQGLQRTVRLVGLDRNPAIVATCQQTASQLGLTAIEFVAGEIADYEPQAPVHLVVSLHACDTATDAALARAIQWGANVILAVPCCQHELAPQLQGAGLRALSRHGILRERIAADATDALRAALLELHGYRTQVLEFIELEHTPKNLLLRAVRRAAPLPAGVVTQRRTEYEALKSVLGVSTLALERLLEENAGGR